MNKSKVLVLDIETSPLLVYTWGLHKQYLTPSQIYKDWHIMAWAAKWYDNPKIYYQDTRNQKDDTKILAPLWKLLDEADIVITQNGRNFDSKRINSRLLIKGFNPPSPYRHLDTYQIVKHAADFTSNKLAYLTNKLCKNHRKSDHPKYAGLNLWLECLKGNKQAWNEMKKYNIADILSTEELYTKIKAWVPDNAPRIYDMTDASYQCGTCGYTGKMREGKPRKAKKYYYRQHSCPKCGAWQKGTKIKEHK